jgi:hypothetical protein
MAGANVDFFKGKQPSVFLGFVDEKITEKYAAGVDFTTSKIGGFPVREKLLVPKRDPQANL